MLRCSIGGYVRDDTCGVLIIHQEKVDEARNTQLKVHDIILLSELFKVLGDPTRLRIIQALSSLELCVCDISAVLDMNQSAVSHQLRVLKQARLVRYRKEGKIVYYSLDDNHIADLLKTSLAHINDKEKV